MRNGFRLRGFWGNGALVALGLALVGCGGGTDHDHGHETGGEHAGHEHVHHAPHGGALAMLGDHAFQIEVLPQPVEGRIDLYVLDGEAEHFVRVSSPAFDARAKAGEQEWVLVFQAVANEATGETSGSSSHFTVLAESLAGEDSFELSFDRLELLGQVFEDVRIPYPEGTHGE